MTWIEHVDTDPPRGRPRRAPWMDDLLAEEGYDPDDHLPLDYTKNGKVNVPGPLAEAMAERYDAIEANENDNDDDI